MKAYRTVHQVLFVLAFVPMILEWWPFYVALIPPLVLIIPYALNERAIERRSREERLLLNDPILHDYRETA
ncbi:hypothetical protein [Arthrobacter roseus]|uniref:hypothetical protein n=1 Tax=Arthrobacter roseus TaxID=136274 RepID=UPI00196404D2|nr:hypothetical protein [Arthrobacter roseus]MBM7847000.1 hypothetical protein [Arthrobacter roseus]